MALKLTPTILKAAYDLLAATEPFLRWNLPDGDDVVFKVLKARHTSASLVTRAKRKPVLGLSEGCNGHINTLLATLAHEMVHLHETQCKIKFRGLDHHGAAFRKWAAQVCKVHGFDLKTFY